MPRPCLTYRDPHDPARPWCLLCRLDLAGGPHHRLWAGLPQLEAKPARRLDCIHLGPALNDQAQAAANCKGCSDKLRECDVHGVCRTKVERDGVACCATCLECEMPAPAAIAAAPTRRPRVTRIDPARLAHASDGKHFNAGLIDHAGRRLLAYRAGTVGATIHIAELGEDLQPRRSVRLDLRHPGCRDGAEDPRLFTWDGALHLSFTGVERVRGEPRPIGHVLVARLSAGLRVERVWQPQYGPRSRTEKNWSFFATEAGELACVYSIDPHRVLVFGHATEAFETAAALPWTGGLLRGGASPVRVGDEWYHWFHGVQWRGTRSHYTLGLYTFSAEPPYRITRCAVEPLHRADDADNARRKHHPHSIVFPCGALLERDRWLVSYGHHDRYCEIVELERFTVDNVLHPVPGV